jgi:hypothetical protein
MNDRDAAIAAAMSARLVQDQDDGTGRSVTTTR